MPFASRFLHPIGHQATAGNAASPIAYDCAAVGSAVVDMQFRVCVDGNP